MTQAVKKPGSRGGHGYYDEHGEWQYGIRPFPEKEPREHEDILRWGVSAYHHLGMTAVPHINDIVDLGPIRAEWDRQYGDSPYMPNVTIREGLLLAHRNAKSGHDDLGRYTSESLRNSMGIIKGLGYEIVDDTAKLAGKPREETWTSVLEHCESLQRLLPGMQDFLKKHPLRLRVMQATKIGKASTAAQYDPGSRYELPTVIISPKYNSSFFHEMGHYIDNKISERSMYASARDEPDDLGKLIGEIKRSDHEVAHLNDLAENVNNIAYWGQRIEIFARFFDTWVGYKLYSTERREFPKLVLEEYGPRLESILKDAGLAKSLREWTAGSHLWKSVVQHPGSRGGHPWWDGHEWRHDHQPVPTIAPIAVPEYDDDPFGDPSEMFADAGEPTDEDRHAYEHETEHALRGIKRHDDAAIRKFIMHRGIRRSDRDQNGQRYFNAEYNDYVPIWARNQANGSTLDQMRRELQEEYPYLEMDTVDDLLVFLEHFEDTRTKKSWHAGSHTGWEDDLSKSDVKHPGSRGGHGYYDERGEWQYGVRPQHRENKGERDVHDLLTRLHQTIPGVEQTLKDKGLRITVVPGAYVPDETGSTERHDWAHVTPNTNHLHIAEKRVASALPHEIFHVLDDGTINSGETLRWERSHLLKNWDYDLGEPPSLTSQQRAGLRLAEKLRDSETFQEASKKMDWSRGTYTGLLHEIPARFFQAWFYHKIGLPEPRQPKDHEHWTEQDFEKYGPLLEDFLAAVGGGTTQEHASITNAPAPPELSASDLSNMAIKMVRDGDFKMPKDPTNDDGWVIFTSKLSRVYGRPFSEKEYGTLLDKVADNWPTIHAAVMQDQLDQRSGGATLESLRERKETAYSRVEDRGYIIMDDTGHLDLLSQAELFEEVDANTALLETALPGLPEFLLAYPLVLVVHSPLNMLTMSYKKGFNSLAGLYHAPEGPDDERILHISNEHRYSLPHEIGHYIDNVTAPLGSKSDDLASEKDGTPLHELAEELREFPEYQAFRAKIEKLQGAGRLKYWDNAPERFARFFEDWVAYKLRGSGIDVPPPSKDEQYEDYSDAAIQGLEPRLMSVLRPAHLVKSLLRWAAGSHAWRH